MKKNKRSLIDLKNAVTCKTARERMSELGLDEKMYLSWCKENDLNFNEHETAAFADRIFNGQDDEIAYIEI